MFSFKVPQFFYSEFGLTSSFDTQVPGKWILSGEHAVLRGSPALVFPLHSLTLRLRFEPAREGSASTVGCAFAGPRGEELRMLFWGVWERALALLDRGLSPALSAGQFQLENSLPVGCGLGASASLCVAVARWFVWRNWLNQDRLYEFARELENLFHLESSGVDIAVALSGCPLHFERNGRQFPLKTHWTPHWYLSYSGRRGITSECVQQVKLWIDAHPHEASEVDQLMRESVSLCESALQTSRELGGPQLILAIQKAHQCFARWGLINGEAEAHMQGLMAAGATAVKPTGSGGGGYVLSLWPHPAPASLAQELIPLG